MTFKEELQFSNPSCFFFLTENYNLYKILLKNQFQIWICSNRLYVYIEINVSQHSFPLYFFLRFLTPFNPWWLTGKETACNAGDLGSTPGSGRSPGKWNGDPLQYSCLGNPMEKGAWLATIHRVSKSWTHFRD